MPVSDRPDFGRWLYFALLLSLSSGRCIGHFHHRLDGQAFAEREVFSLRSCRRACRRVGSRRAEARRNRSPQCLRETMPRVPSLLE